MLPKIIYHVKIPPIKCQGIKSKLINFITSNVSWNDNGCWIEPFLGSGVVLFNVNPERAIVSDKNPHLINFYKSIQEKKITPSIVRAFLESEGEKLLERGEDHYYEVRERFNQYGNSLDFLFLNRSCFNGMMRFNKKGFFNVPFCRKPERFRQAYVTKIVNQVQWVSEIMEGKDWTFKHCDWTETIALATSKDFIYLDPPYIGRHTDYFDSWKDEDAELLATITRNSPAGFALSMWKENKYRKNEHLDKCWSGLVERTMSHFYHVGATEALRNAVEEGLIIKPGSQSEDFNPDLVEQLSIAEF